MNENKRRQIQKTKDMIESLRHLKRTTSYKDDDIRREIQEEIDDLTGWLERL